MSVDGRRSGIVPPRRMLTVVVAVPVVVVVTAVLLAGFIGLPIEDLSRDPFATLDDANPFVGAQSVIGIAILWLAAAISLFTAAVLRRSGRAPEIAGFLFWSGLATAFLAVDDHFQIHDDLAQRYLDVRERYVLIAYGSLALLYLLAFARRILRTEWATLALAFVLLGASIGLDYISGRMYLDAGEWTDQARVILFLEDAAKLAGITAWAAYFVRLSYVTVTHRVLGPDGSGVTAPRGPGLSSGAHTPG